VEADIRGLSFSFMLLLQLVSCIVGHFLSSWRIEWVFYIAADATKLLVQDLDARFLAHHIMNTMGILYP